MNEVDTISTSSYLGTEPVRDPGAKWVSVILGILLVAFAIIIGREFWVLYGDTTATSWLEPVYSWIGTLTYQSWMFPVGILLCVIALVLLCVTFWPRKSTHRQIESATSLWMRPIDIARLCTAQAEKVPGVLHAHSTVTPKHITVSVNGDTTTAEDLTRRVTEHLTPHLAHVAGAPTLTVHVKEPEGVTEQ